MSDPPTWPSPEAAGLSSRAVLAFLNRVAADGLEMHGLSIWRHGQPVIVGHWWPYHAGTLHQLNSVSKSFVSTAVGLCLSEGRLNLNDSILNFFPEHKAGAAPGAEVITIRDLLTMSSGHAAQLRPILRFSAPAAWTQTYLSQPLAHTPGTHFLYDSADTFMLSAAIQRVSGQRVLDYLRPRLLDPLGIGEARWLTDPAGTDAGGWGLSLTTGDLARFGELYRCGGKWQGQTVLESGWVAEATCAQIATAQLPDPDWQQGYGYQFWRCCHGAYRADGMYGQFVVTLPAQAAVIAFTAGTHRMQAVLEAVWATLLPGFASGPLDEVHGSELRSALDGLHLALPFEPSLAVPFAGTRTFAFDPGVTLYADDQVRPVSPPVWQQVTLNWTDPFELIWSGPAGRHTLHACDGAWQVQSSGLFADEALVEVATHAAWRSDGAFQITLRLLAQLRQCTLTYRPGQAVELRLPAPLEQTGELVIARENEPFTSHSTQGAR